MGIEKRRRKRIPKRVTVRFGEKDFSRSGIIDDVSTSGAFVVAQYLPPIGTRVHLQLMIGQNESVFLEAEVKRHKVVPLQMRQVAKGGFGVHFLSPGELMAEVAPRLKAMGVASAVEGQPPASERKFEVTYVDLAEFKHAWTRELRFGGVYVHSKDALEPETPVAVTLTLAFAGGGKFTFSAKVTQVISGPSKGLALAFQNRTVLERSLAPYVAT